MRVLHVLNRLRPSGAETMLRLAAGPWQREGVELEIMCLGSELGEYAPSLLDVGYRIHHLPLRPVHRFVPSFMSFLWAGDYDIIHVHPERANIAIATAARFVGRAGVVRTIHSNFNFEGKLRWKRRMQRAFLQRSGVRHVAIGESVAETEMTTFDNPTSVIFNTFDEHRFRPPLQEEREQARTALGLADPELAVVMVGNCSRTKNHRAVFEALALPSAPPVRLFHVGIEDEESFGERQLVAQLGLSDRVDFLGFHGDVPSLLHAADCFVMPSHYEGMSIAGLEALACGVPCILADVVGLRDLRAHVPDIWWVTPDPASIADALAGVAELDEEQLHRWRMTTAPLIRERFGIARHSSAYLKLYRELAEPRAS